MKSLSISQRVRGMDEEVAGSQGVDGEMSGSQGVDGEVARSQSSG